MAFLWRWQHKSAGCSYTTSGDAAPNQESCLALIQALAVETREGWLEEHHDLNMDLPIEHKYEQLRHIREVVQEDGVDQGIVIPWPDLARLDRCNLD